MLSRQKVVANSTEVVVVVDVTCNSIYEKLISFPYTISSAFKDIKVKHLYLKDMLLTYYTNSVPFIEQ